MSVLAPRDEPLVASLAQYIISARWTVAELFAGPILQLMAVPLLLSAIGAELYGHYSIMLAIAGLCALGARGMPHAVLRYGATVRSGADYLKLVTRGQRLSTTTTVILIVVALTALVAARAEALSPINASTVSMGSLLSGAALGLAILYDSLWASALKSRGEFIVAAKLEVLARCGVFAASVGSALMSSSPHAMVLLSSVVVSVIARIKAAKAYRLAGNLPRLQGDALRFDREFRNYANWSWTQSIAGTLFTNLDRLLIGHLLGSVAAGAFFICIQIVSPLHMIFVAVFQQLLPRAAGLAVDYAQARDLSWVSKAVLGNLLLAVVLMLASLQVVPWFLSLWVGTAFASDNRNVIDILVIAYAILAGNVASYYVLMGLGRARLVTTAQLVAGVTLVAVLAIGTAYLDLGLEGAALARLAFSVVAIYLCVAAVREAKRGTKVCQ